MTRSTSPKAADQQLTTPPLLPLEYCRPERAAELLNCKVEDLYHWAATGAIRMYIRAEKAVQPELTTQISVMCDELDDNLIYARKLRFGASFTAYQIVDGGQNFGWSNAIAQVSGFWALGGWYFVEWEDDGVISGEPDGCDCFDLYALPDEKAPPVWAVRLNIPNIKDNLWLMREDLEKLQRHIISGTRFDLDEAEQIPKPIMTPPANEFSRITANQSRAIVELLRVLGFTDEDFKGSISALQKKISSKGLSGTLTNIDRNTLIDWLKRGGVR